MIFRRKIKSIKFDKNSWIQNSEARIYMVPYIINNSLLNNLTKDEVRAFLGYEFNDVYSNTWSYYIGEKKSLFSSKYYLFVYFNEFGKVFKVLKK